MKRVLISVKPIFDKMPVFKCLNCGYIARPKKLLRGKCPRCKFFNNWLELEDIKQCI